MKRFFFIFSLFLFLFLISAGASAIKISGISQYTVFFQPNTQHELIFTISDAARPASVPIKLEGPMAQYARAEPSQFDLDRGQSVQIKIKISFPADIPKGVHSLDMSATEVPRNNPGGGMVIMPSAGLAIKIVNTDKEQDCSIGLFDTEVTSDRVKTVLNIKNDGLNQIGNVYADLVLTDDKGSVVTNWKTGAMTVPALDSKTFESSAELDEAEPGNYYVKGTLFCGTQKLSFGKSTVSRASQINFKEFRVYKKDGILNVEFDLENEFKAFIPVTGFAYFYKDGTKITTKPVMMTNLDALSQKTYAFRKRTDWLQIPAGDYMLKGKIIYSGKEEVKEASITLTEEDVTLKEDTKSFGFGQKVPAQEKVAVEEEPKPEIKAQGVSIGKSTLIRIMAGLIILVLILLIVLKKYKKK